MEKPSLDTIKAGAMRFNTDSSQMEIYDGNQWTGILGDSPTLHTGGTRALFWHGDPNTDVIQFFNVDSTGNATDFGDSSRSARQTGALGSRTRSCCAGGDGNTRVNIIEFVTIASTGDAQDFGELSFATAGSRIGSCSNGHGGL